MSAPALAVPGPRGGRARHYRHPLSGVQVPSVTTLLDILDKPALVRWAAKEVAEFAADHLASVQELDRAAIVDLLKGAPWRKSSAAADVGTHIHASIEAHLAGLPLPEMEVGDVNTLDYCTAAVGFIERLGPVAKATSEITVFSHTFAGTTDLLLRMQDGRTILVDWKTTAKENSSGPWPESALQVAAYAHAHEAAIEVDGTWFMRPWPDPDEAWVVELRPRRGLRAVRIDWVPLVPKVYAALELFTWQEARPWFADAITVKKRPA